MKLGSDSETIRLLIRCSSGLLVLCLLDLDCLVSSPPHFRKHGHLSRGSHVFGSEAGDESRRIPPVSAGFSASVEVTVTLYLEAGCLAS